ncbi:HAD family phosphatase [Tateyamaria omphalii]|uniref:HAD family hydrolase n=1 Tax=Tateyamaria omphalii TaxID=299262 RepID=UPI001C9A00F6|nr:HAD family phosphatase [Tateyamaria omphalii]MBY5932658.1 HAD family phosphatase [Tateyamaria omphalii]
MPPYAYLFDMDGLLLDSERIYGAVARDILVPWGYEAAAVDAFFLTMVGCSGAESVRRLEAFLRPETDVHAFNAAWHAEVAVRVGADVPLRPTVRDSLERLVGQGARMAVVTSTNGEAARRHLGRAGLLDHFEAVLGGDEVSARKPDPAPYREAAAALGLAPDLCAAFEDSDRGITAAVHAGCRAVQVPDMRPPDLPLPALGQLVAPDLAAALEMVGAFGQRSVAE